MKNISITSLYILISLCFCTNSFGQVLNQKRNYKGFEKFAQRVEPNVSWVDLKIPDSEIAVIKEIVDSLKHILENNKKYYLTAESAIESGKIVLFNGENKSNKTLTSQIIAKTLGMDLYRIDLSLVVSKYIGETEKNLGDIFDKAENKNWILFFDEADALFGKRSRVKNNNNQSVNIELTYFLHRLEFYQGLAIVSTTYKTQLNESKIFRFKRTVNFPIPKN